MYSWLIWLSIGLSLEVIGATTTFPTLSEGFRLAWQIDWLKPVLLAGWTLLTGHLFLGWFD